jgi:[methyl-Co(III) methanol-specific corrinoid protein]:coenzyme M methyltransferase
LSQPLHEFPIPRVFSGLIHVTAEGLAREGLTFVEVHRDAHKLARAALSTHKYAGWMSATLPLDMCVEAELLGAQIDFGADALTPSYPRVRLLADSLADSRIETDVPTITQNRRPFPSANPLQSPLTTPLPSVNPLESPLTTICASFRLVKAAAPVFVSGYIPGPFTLLSLISDPKQLYRALKADPQHINAQLAACVAVLSQSARAYHEAGADYITIHEMGGSPAFLGAPRFREFVLPALTDLLAAFDAPRVLSICGDIGASLPEIGQLPIDALSIDQSTDPRAARAALPKQMRLFGNLDPVATLSAGNPDSVRAARDRAFASGADAVWPGCDLHLPTPLQNLQALID